MEVPRQIREQVPFQVQMRPQPQDGQLTLNQINRAVMNANNEYNTYWDVNMPNRLLKLAGARIYVKVNYPNTRLYNRFVYWPDYRVAGSIIDIYKRFRQAGINQVQVGSIYNMTNGQTGCYRKTVPLSLDVIIACSIDPLNPAHQIILDQLISEPSSEDIEEMGYEIKKLKLQQPYSQVTSNLLDLQPIGKFPGGLPYQQQAEQRLLPIQQTYRQQLGSELSVIPSGVFPGFPGGTQYLTAQQRGVGQYGMRY